MLPYDTPCQYFGVIRRGRPTTLVRASQLHVDSLLQEIWNDPHTTSSINDFFYNIKPQSCIFSNNWEVPKFLPIPNNHGIGPH